MAQLETAAGGEAVNPDSSSPATDPIEAIVDEFLGEDEQEEESPTDTEDGEAEEAELTEEDVEGETDDEAELPPIDVPVSWKAEEAERFKALPRETQEYLAQREAEREKFVQSKAQEAKQARSEVERAALAELQAIQSATAEQLEQYAAHFEVQQPDPRLITQNPEAYAQQLAQYQYFTAQREQAQRNAETARAEAQKAQQQLEAREAEEFRAVLNEQFPEFLEPANAKLREDLSLIAKELGYSAELLGQANASDILALKRASDWKAKAARYDTLMAKKMEKVRAAKDLPPVARPGTAKNRAQVSAQAINSSWERVKQTKSPDAMADYLSKAGII